MMDDIGQKSFFENYGLELTLEGISQATPGLVKRVFNLKKINLPAEQPSTGGEAISSTSEGVRQIIHLQTTRW